jgi:hypothetical protein
MKKILSLLAILLAFGFTAHVVAAPSVLAADAGESSGAGENILPQPVPAEVLSEKAFVRAEHDNKSKRLATLEEGDAIDLLAEWNGDDAFPWYKVATDTGEGWIYGKNVQCLDGSPEATVAAKPSAQTSQAAARESGVMKSDGDFVTVISRGQGTGRTQALNAAWVEAVRLAIGMIISSKSELNNNEFAEHTIAHSRGVIESFDILSEQNDGKRTTVTIQALVRKEILIDATKIYTKAQTVKADIAEAITTADKQKSGIELLREVLESYTPDMFYSAQLNPKLQYNEDTQKHLVIVSEKFNEDLFWQDFLPKLRKALEGLALQKEKKFYIPEVQAANQSLVKEKWIAGAGLYFFGNVHVNNRWVNNANIPYSWAKDAEDGVGSGPRSRGRYMRYIYNPPSGGFRDDTGLLKISVPDNSSSFTVYYLNKLALPFFVNFQKKMNAKITWVVTFYDKDGNEIHSRTISMGKTGSAVAVYRSYFIPYPYKVPNYRIENIMKLQEEIIERGFAPMPDVIAFAPGYLNFEGSELTLERVGYTHETELTKSQVQRLDSMKLEVVFEN